MVVQEATILDDIGAKDDGGGGDNWSYKTCEVPVKLSPPTNQHRAIYRPDVVPVTQPIVSKHRREKYHSTHTLAHPKLTWGSSSLLPSLSSAP